MVSEEAEAEAAGAGMEVFAVGENGAGLALKGPAGLRKPAFALIAERLCLTGADSLAFRQNALIAVYP